MLNTIIHIKIIVVLNSIIKLYNFLFILKYNNFLIFRCIINVYILL